MDKCLITGGVGFIGANLAERLIRDGRQVRIFDNLSRAGVEKNLSWLNENFHGRFEFIRGDVRDASAVTKAIEDVDTVFHFASQVAVTTSVADPRMDFESNALGTLNVLEGARQMHPLPAILFTSTNKVYGKIAHVGVVDKGGRYEFDRLPEGVDESQPLDFYSPYGCSKGAGDQYVRDYARIYGMKTVVFRMSCIYGPHQFGNEDQGWVAHFVISAIAGRPIKIYGDGRQVRDILYVDDLVEAFVRAAENLDKTAGEVFNIGGGPTNSISLLELLELLEQITGSKISTEYSDWRPGDQKVYVSNIKKARRIFGWIPCITRESGIRLLYDWAIANHRLFR
jgi:CDP-paratose 2-epimerase